MSKNMTQTLGSFIRSKLKDRSLRVDEFLYKSGISRSSFYRILNGSQSPSADISSAIIATLNMSASEEMEYNYYVDLMNTDENTRSIREEITSMLFGAVNYDYSDSPDIILYDGDRYFRTVDDVFEIIENASALDGFVCSFRIINCCKASIILPLKKAVDKINGNSGTYEIEHLIGFSDNNLKENINTLSEILPLLAVKNYVVRCGDSSASMSDGMMKNFIIVDYSWDDDNGTKQKKQLCLNFLDGSTSVCMVVSDPCLSDFLNRSYANLCRFYFSSLVVNKQLQTFSTRLLDLESHYDWILFKADPCDSRIPYEAFEHMKNRVSLEEKKQFIQTFVGVMPNNEIETEAYMEKTFEYLRERAFSIKARAQTDICTQDGLRRFAENRALSDHVNFIPAFDKTEMKMIFTSMIEKLLDTSNKYTLYILKRNYAHFNVLISVYKNHGLLIENIDPNISTIDMSDCFIEHAGVATAFASFAETEIPAKYALSQDETVKFLQGLIDEYCS